MRARRGIIRTEKAGGIDMASILYPTELAAVEAFGRAALPETERDGRERCAAILCGRTGYRLGHVWRGFHNNVILQAVCIAVSSVFCGRTALVHTHPRCTCHAGEQFSGERDAHGRVRRLGDACVPGMGRIYRIWLVSPEGKLSCWDGINPPLLAGQLMDEHGAPLRIRTLCGSRLHGWLAQMN